jgi:hypothetical protein
MIALAVLAGILALLGVALAPVAANATAPTTCIPALGHWDYSDTVGLPGMTHSDSGNGTPSTWALDGFVRKVTICATGYADEAKSIEYYHAVVTDTGSFKTILGAGSPNGTGAAITHVTTGTFTGGFTADFTAKKDGPVSGHGGTTSTWVRGYFGEEFKGASINDDWSWIYTTCCGERWTDAAKNNDGQGATAGNITGKTCKPSPAPTSSTSPAPPTPPASASPTPVPSNITISAPVPMAVVATLPVTG